MQRIAQFVFLAVLCLLVFFITKAYYAPDEPSEQISSTYRSDDAAFDFLKRFSPFQKKAILRVKGRASVGYDLEGLDLRIDEESRTVTLMGMGKPMLLSLEHDVDYFDMEAGTFASFTAQDHTKINAQVQRDEMLMVLRSVIENSGWHFELGEGVRDVRAKSNERL